MFRSKRARWIWGIVAFLLVDVPQGLNALWDLWGKAGGPVGSAVSVPANTWTFPQLHTLGVAMSLAAVLRVIGVAIILALLVKTEPVERFIAAIRRRLGRKDVIEISGGFSLLVTNRSDKTIGDVRMFVKSIDSWDSKHEVFVSARHFVTLAGDEIELPQDPPSRPGYTYLGANRRDIRRLVLRPAISCVGIGVCFGSAGALFASHLVDSRLITRAPTDAVVYAGVIVAVAITALVATWRRARRAVSVNPAITLRTE